MSARAVGVVVLLATCAFAQTGALSGGRSTPTGSPKELQITRPVRTWEFLPAVGHKAGIFGHENGTVEAWVYPMKIVRDFHLVFHFGDREVPAEALARSITVRPESATIHYASDTFTLDETVFVPPGEAGAVIALDITAFQPVSVEARFVRDFQLMWPAALGGTYLNWDDKLHAFSFGEEQHKWFALLGSPSAASASSEFDTNYASSQESSLRLAAVEVGRSRPAHARQLIVLAGSVSRCAAAAPGCEDAGSTYQRLAQSYEALRSAAAKQYADALAATTSLELPDPELQDAYDWARVSMAQGLVNNPFLGEGLVAGYRTSGVGERPGFAWFFGRDSEWTTFALDSEGDFTTARTALEFLSKFQRQDGKIPHEISQAAKLVPWFTDFPYPWASADATPLYILAVSDYAAHSGDADFVKAHWDNLSRAYTFLRSTWNAAGIARNAGVGHGWIEGGPLVPVQSEFYEDGLSVAALRAISGLAHIAGHDDISAEAKQLFASHYATFNDTFWNPDGKFFAYAIDQQDKRLDTASVLTTVPMWFGVTDAAKSDATITQLADASHSADWGMRIISADDPRYDPSGYHFGSVWPLFTGWGAVGEYRYHRPLAAYQNLRANALLALDGSAGHVTEVLSGSFFETLSTASPHQIWSAAMVVSPFLRGMLGIEADAQSHTLQVSPHTPADWTWWRAHNVRVGNASVNLSYSYPSGAMTFDITAENGTGATMALAPAFSPRATITSVTLNGKPAAFTLQKNRTDQHVLIRVPLDAPATVRITAKDDFGVAIHELLPPLGSASQGLRIIDESWQGRNDLALEVSGAAGREYQLAMRGGEQVRSVEGAELVDTSAGRALRIRFPVGDGYQHSRVTLHFASAR